MAATAVRSGMRPRNGQASSDSTRTNRPPSVSSIGAFHQGPGIGSPAPTTALSRSSSPDTEATAPIDEIIPETSATKVSAATASQPSP